MPKSFIDLLQSLNIRALYHRIVKQDHRISQVEVRMAAIEKGLAAVEAETTRIADWITANLPDDPAIEAKFAPVIEHLKAIGAAGNPVPDLPPGLTL